MQNSYYVRLHQDNESDSDVYVYSDTLPHESAAIELACALSRMGFGRADVVCRGPDSLSVRVSYYRGHSV